MKFLKKYKLLTSILLITFMFLPFTIYKPAETDRVAVATSIGIDKNGDEVELAINVVTPSNSGATSGGTIGSVKTFLGSGKNLSGAIAQISLSVGKSVGLAHCDAVVVSKEVCSEDITQILDYFIRSNNLTSNAIVFVTEGAAKDVIKASAQESSRFALTLSDIISFNKMFAFGDSINIDNFYINYFSGSGVSILPVISTGAEDESKSDTQSQNNTSQSGSEPASESEGSSSQNGGDVIKNQGKMVVIKNGKYVCDLNKKQVEAISLINKKSTKGNITAKNVTNDLLNNANLIYQIYAKDVKLNCYFAGDVPLFNFDIDLILQINEIMMENHSIQSINGTTTFLDDAVIKALNLTIHENLSDLINLAKNKRTDFLKVDQNFKKFDNKKWDNFITSLEDKEDYLDKVVFTVNTKIRGKI